MRFPSFYTKIFSQRCQKGKLLQNHEKIVDFSKKYVRIVVCAQKWTHIEASDVKFFT